MKKIILLLLFFAISLFANIGKISAFSGDVKVDRNAKLLNATIGFILEQKDTVKTSDNAKAQIVFEDGTVISIGKNAVLNINEFINDTSNPKNSKVDVKFAEGTFKTITGGIGKVAPDRFKLQTKSASIGIRGTIIYGDQSMIACTQGEIEVEAGGIKQILPAGTMTKIQPDGTPTDPEPIEDEDLGGVADDVGDTGNGNDGTSPQGNTEGEMEIEPLPVGLIKQNTPLNILPTSQNLLDLDAIETINIENIQQQSNDINQKDYDKLIPTFAILSSSINNGLITYTVTLSNPTDTNSPAIVTVNVNGTNYDITIPPGESFGVLTLDNLTNTSPYESTLNITATIESVSGGNFANLNYDNNLDNIALPSHIATNATLLSSINNGLITYTVTLSNPTDTNSPAIVTVNVNGTNYDITIPPGESFGVLTLDNLTNTSPYESTLNITATIESVSGGNFANLNYDNNLDNIALPSHIATDATLLSSINNGLITYTVTLSNPTDTNSPAIVTVNVNGTNYDITIPPGESSNSFTFNATNLIYNTPYNSTFSLNANIVQIIGGNFANLNYSDTPHTVVLQGAFVPPTEPIVVLPQQFSFSGVGKRLEFYSNSLSLLDINGIVEVTPTYFDSSNKIIASLNIGNGSAPILDNVTTLGFNEGDDVYWGYWNDHIMDLPWIVGIQTPDAIILGISSPINFSGSVIGKVYNTNDYTYSDILNSTFTATIDFGGSANNMIGNISFQDSFENNWNATLTGSTNNSTFSGTIQVGGTVEGDGNFAGYVYGEDSIKAIGGGFFMFGESTLKSTTYHANGVFKAKVVQ